MPSSIGGVSRTKKEFFGWGEEEDRVNETLFYSTTPEGNKKKNLLSVDVLLLFFSASRVLEPALLNPLGNNTRPANGIFFF